MSQTPHDEMPCNVFVEIVTEYLEDALPLTRRAAVDEHVAECPGCASVLAQWREVIRLSGSLREELVDEVDPSTRAALMSAFRRSYG